MPRVSVIIPAYNSEASLPETLASVGAQTYRDWEIVVADDCSTDRTVEIAEAFDGRLTVLRGSTNQGPAAARNRAIAASTGELLAFLDADDLWLPGYLERMTQLYDDNRAGGSKVGIVLCDTRILGPNGFFDRTYMDYMRFPVEVTIDRMLVSNLILVLALTPRSVVDEAGAFCLEIFGPEDYDLWLRILELGYGAVASPEALAVYRLQPKSVSNSSNLPRMARSLQLTYRRALDRGKLTPRQQRIARRQLRLQCALEQIGLILADRQDGSLAAGRVARNLPRFAWVALENPDRWASTVRILVGRGSPLSQVAR
jgi:teichuronic acid biosynthesis glycosyltransferase TuaG